MNGVLGAGANAVLFAAAVFGSREDGHEILGFETVGATGRDTESAAGAGLFNNDGQPFMGQFFSHGFLLAFQRASIARTLSMGTTPSERDDFSHEKESERPGLQPAHFPEAPSD